MKFKQTIWTIAIIISVSVILGCGNGKEVKSKESKIKLLDLGSVPVYSGEIPQQTEEPDGKEPGDQAAEKITEKIYRDDFDSFDPSFWTVVEEKTNRLVPEKAGIDNGNLVIEATVTDRNPFFFSKSIPVSRGDTVTVKRRVFVHPGNRYANISFSIKAAEDDKQFVPGVTKLQNICSVQYLDFQYDPGRFPITEGVLVTVPGYKDSGEYTAWEPAFDKWMDEEWEIHTDTGLIRYTLDGKTTELHGKPVTLPFIRVYMNAYGWHTGHKVVVDYVEIDVRSGSLEPEGMKKESPVVSREIAPSEEPVNVSTESGVSVELPRLASSSPEVLSISPVVFEDDNKFSGVDVEFGDRHDFDGPVRITIPIPEGTVPDGGDPSKYVVPVSYNAETGEWVEEPCIYQDNSITIISDHLSLFALSEGKGVKLTPINTDILSKQDAVEAAWSSMTSNLDWVSQGQSFASLVSEAPFLESLGTQLERIGAGFAIIDISKNIARGNTTEAQIGTLKMISGWALGKFSTLGTQIAGIGTFFIDYSLNTLATNTLEAQYDSFEWAYTKYYRSEGKKSIIVWYKEIKEILSTSSSPEEASRRLNKIVDSHVKAIWNDEGTFEGYLAEARGHGWAGNAGLTDQIKLKLENNYKALLGQMLEPAFLKATEWVETEAYRQQYRAASRLMNSLDKKVVFRITVSNSKEEDQLDAVILSGDTPVLVAGKSQNGKVSFYAEMPFSTFFSGPKPTHVVLQGILQIDDKTTVPFSSRKAFDWSKTTQKISFIIDREKNIQDLQEEELTEETPEKKVEEDKKVEKPDIQKKDDSKQKNGKALSFIQKIKVLETSDSPDEIRAILEDIKGSLKVREDDGEREYYKYYKDSSLESKGISLTEYLPKSNGEESFFFPSKTWFLYGIGKHGPSVTYYHDGQTVQEEEFFIRDKLNGPYKSYYKNGNLKSSGYYTNEIKTGHWEYYLSSGRLDEEGDYDSNGKKDGTWMETDIIYGMHSKEPFPIEYSHGEVTDDSARDEAFSSLSSNNN